MVDVDVDVVDVDVDVVDVVDVVVVHEPVDTIIPEPKFTLHQFVPSE